MMASHGWRGRGLGLLVALASAGAGAQPVFIESLGTLQGALDGQFNTPRAIALDATGNLYIADGGNNRVQKFDYLDGALTHTYSFGVAGTAGGQFDQLSAIAVDAAGNVYTAEQGAGRVQRFTPGGGSLVFDYASGSLGAADGQFNNPLDLAFDAAGDLYVVDAANRRVQVFTPGVGALAHVASFNAGGQLLSPTGVAVGADGTIYIVDSETDKMYTAARLGGVVGLTGVVTVPTLNPMDVALTAGGSLYIPVADADKLIRYGYNGTGLVQQAPVSNVGLFPMGNPDDAAVDGRGNVYAVDSDNHRVHRWFDPDAIAPGNSATLANLTIGNLSSTLTLAPGKAVNVVGATIVEPGATMTVQSDLFTTQDLGVFGGTYHGKLAGVANLAFLSGTLRVTDDAGLIIDAAGPTGGSMTIGSLKTLIVNNVLTVDATGRLDLTGGLASAKSLVNNGTLNATGTTLALTDITSANNGQVTLTGGGLRLTRALSNAGQIDVTDSALRIDTAFTNQAAGRLDASGLTTLRFDGGATNNGVIAIDAGDAILTGALINGGGALIDLTNAANAVFGGAVTNDGAINVEAGATASFDNAYSGTGAITGGGLSTFNGAVRPGGGFDAVEPPVAIDTPAAMNIAGDATLKGSLTLQLGGTTPGAEFDRLNVGGALMLGGSLLIQLDDGFVPTYGQSFVIIDAAGAMSGTFAQVTGLQVSAGVLLGVVYDEVLNQVRLIAPNALVAGDTDGDFDVDDFDLLAAISNFTGSLGAGVGGKGVPDGDTDGDSDVDDFDLLTMISGFTGSLAPPAAPVPEPASLVLWGAALIVLGRHRRSR